MGHGPYVRHCQSKAGTSEHQGFDPSVCLSKIFEPLISGTQNIPKSLGGLRNVIFFKGLGGRPWFWDIPHLLPCHVLISPRAIVLWFLQRDVGATKRYLRVMGRNDKLRRLPRQREAPPERWETAFRRFAKGAPWQIWVFLLKQQTSQKMTCDRCTVSDWMSRVALHIGQIQIHDSTVRMIQNSSNLYKRRIVLRTWAPSQEEEISSTNKFSIDPLLCEEAYVW